MNEKATIFDYARMCKSFDPCGGSCPLFAFCSKEIEYSDLDEANEIILKWCKEHPVETRQDRLLKIIPNLKINEYGIVQLNPCALDDSIECDGNTCFDCRKNYWLAEVEENGDT